MQTQAVPPAILPSLRGKTILVIEDHGDSLELLMTSLRLIGANVYGARSLLDAQRHVSLYRPDLIVCDIHLGDGTGLEFISWLRGISKSRGSTTPCVALTGYATVFPPERAKGFDAYMRKPVDIAKLCTTVAALIGLNEPRQSA